MEKEKLLEIANLKEQMEYYWFLCQKEKPINRDKYIYYLSKASNYKDLYEEALSKAGITQEELMLELEKIS